MQHPLTNFSLMRSLVRLKRGIHLLVLKSLVAGLEGSYDLSKNSSLPWRCPRSGVTARRCSFFGYRSVVPIVQELLRVVIRTLTADLVNYLASHENEYDALCLTCKTCMNLLMQELLKCEFVSDYQSD